jgi:HEAT repeat protein
MLLGSDAGREPLTRRALDTIGPDVARLLVELGNHPAEALLVRVRALAALVHYPSQDTRSFLAGLLHEPALAGAGIALRAQALRSLGRAFGEDAVDAVAALREDPAPDVRAAVAEGLGDTGSERARQVLEVWLPNEPVIAVRAAIDAGLRRLRGF